MYTEYKTSRYQPPIILGSVHRLSIFWRQFGFLMSNCQCPLVNVREMFSGA